jgi:peptidoglycan/LPS O-acetylase OafA/YrhL
VVPLATRAGTADAAPVANRAGTAAGAPVATLAGTTDAASVAIGAGSADAVPVANRAATADAVPGASRAGATDAVTGASRAGATGAVAGAAEAEGLRRTAAREPYVAELDGLRGIAILMVMVHRMFPRAAGTPWPVEAGWAGVDLFFVISGFLIAGILIDSREDPDYFRNFYARRVLRIFPLFYLLVGGMLIAFPLASHGAFLEQSGSPLWYLLQLGNVPEALLGKDPPYWLAPVWSLAIEEQFYLTFPLVVRLVEPRRLARVLVGVAIFALAMRLATTALVPDRERIQYLFTLCRLDTIAIGCLLAVIVRSARYARWRAKLPRLLVPIAITCAAILVVTELDRTTWFGRTFGYDVVALGFGALVLLVLEHRDRAATAALRFAPLRYLGKLCFGLYLLHRPADTLVSELVERAGLDGESLAWLPVKIAVAVALATVSWRLLERPFLKLKRRFSSRALVPAALAALLIGCSAAPAPNATADASPLDGAGAALDAGPAVDAPAADAPAADAPAIDAAPAPLGRVLYPEDQLVSPLTPDLAAGLARIAAPTAAAHVFAKIGDSMTASASFATCFDASPDLGTHTELAATRSFFAAGDAAGSTPYARASLAATGGWTTTDELTGNPAPLDQELTALAPRYGAILLGTNDVRFGRAIDAFACDLWEVVDRTIARGTIPILSTMPAMHGDPGANARIPLFNRVIRAIAQGRGVPLVDLHRALAALPEDGLGSDGIHPTAAPEGACALTSSGLGYGYNWRNLLTLQALDRARRSTSETIDRSAPRRAGAGSHASPYRAAWPLVDLADTRTGEATFSTYACGITATGHELVYRVDLGARTAIDAYAIGRAPVAADVAILDGALAATACVAGGAKTATATVGPGPVYIVVDSPTAMTEGEVVVVVQPHT